VAKLGFDDGALVLVLLLFFLLLLVLVTALTIIARRLTVPYPIVMVLGGLVLSAIPGLPEFELPPDLVFLLFLPPLLFSAAFFTSPRDLATFAQHGYALADLRAFDLFPMTAHVECVAQLVRA